MVWPAIPLGSAFILFAGGGIYAASRTAVAGLAGAGPGAATGGRLAAGISLPTYVVAIWAAASGHGEVAMNIVFGTAVGGLLLAGGAAVLLAPPQTRGDRLLWSMLAMTGFIAFVIGCHGVVTNVGATVLLAEGAILFATVRPPASPPVVGPLGPAPRHPVIRSLQLVIAAGLAAEAGWLAMKGLAELRNESARMTPGLMATSILCPLLVLPAVGFSTDLAQRGKTAEVLQASVWHAAGNICLLAPLLLAATRIRFLALNWHTFMLARKGDNPLPLPDLVFPALACRIDVLFIIITGLFLLPVALGRWQLSKRDGLAMTLAYGLYLFLPIYFATAAHK